VGLGFASFLACARPTGLAIIDAGPTPSIQTTDGAPSTDGAAAAVWVDAGPVALPDTTLGATVDDGGAIDLLLPDASIPAAATLRFDTSALLEDLRVRVLTAEDHLADNRATVTVDDGGTHVVLTPMRAWPARSCCRFRVDGEIGRAPASSAATYLPFEATFAVVRDPNAPVPAAHPHRRHRRR
jgi:hypothetical protein